jgi:uncharacterized HhH-GPD family protein
MAVLSFTGDPEADALLSSDPFALLVGLLLDQQVPMEWAFRGPATLRERLGSFDAKAIAAMDPDELEAIFRERPALHRYPGSMAKRTHALARHVVDEYGGNAAAIWREAKDAGDLLTRVEALPGYGPDKSKILIAILGKRLHQAPEGWERVAKPFSDDKPRSIADVDSPEALVRVRDWKRVQKANGKGKAD